MSVKRINILVVDDDLYSRKLLEVSLAAEGYAMRTAGNGEEEEPEWADGDGDSNQAQTSTVTSQSKRNLLFEV